MALLRLFVLFLVVSNDAGVCALREHAARPHSQARLRAHAPQDEARFAVATTTSSAAAESAGGS